MQKLDTDGFFIMPDGSRSSDHKNPKAGKKRSKKGMDKPEKAKKQKVWTDNSIQRNLIGLNDTGVI